MSGICADVIERGGKRFAREAAAAARPDHLAAEAEPAVDRADMGQLEQHAVGIAMHDPLDRAVRIVGDRIGVFDGRARRVPARRE